MNESKKLAIMPQKSAKKKLLKIVYFIIFGEQLMQTEKNGAKIVSLALLCLQFGILKHRMCVPRCLNIK